ncbi:hypothetical protein EVAR_54138_1 [Eumeta japonica]|uniref:Uncharacterized protein n=1 Tax=Eumeta variegata TaxID=151549 RepID=A0A4C1Z1Q6_EUMVA|nr:hypothetical protein EVAR_54138_1 [Eumeta japonica]
MSLNPTSTILHFSVSDNDSFTYTKTASKQQLQSVLLSTALVEEYNVRSTEAPLLLVDITLTEANMMPPKPPHDNILADTQNQSASIISCIAILMKVEFTINFKVFKLEEATTVRGRRVAAVSTNGRPSSTADRRQSRALPTFIFRDTPHILRRDRISTALILFSFFFCHTKLSLPYISNSSYPPAPQYKLLPHLSDRFSHEATEPKYLSEAHAAVFLCRPP